MQTAGHCFKTFTEFLAFVKSETFTQKAGGEERENNTPKGLQEALSLQGTQNCRLAAAILAGQGVSACGPQLMGQKHKGHLGLSSKGRWLLIAQL